MTADDVVAVDFATAVAAASAADVASPVYSFVVAVTSAVAFDVAVATSDVVVVVILQLVKKTGLLYFQPR